jgi:hypothetical protein
MKKWYVLMSVALVMLARAETTMATPDYGATLDAGWHIGTGLSADNFAIYRDDSVELGLKAHERFAGDLPQIAGVYTAPAGTSWFTAGGYNVAKWNFDASVFLYQGTGITYEWQNGLAMVTAGTPTDAFGNHQVDLYVDFDPAQGNTDRAMIDLTGVLYDAGADLDKVIGLQLSENVMFQYMLALPGAGDFDPYALGDYEFTLAIGSAQERQIDMTVQVVPVPSAILLGVLGLVGTAGLKSRKFV